MAVSNDRILGKIWLEGTTEFQQTVPAPTQGQLEATIQALKDGNNDRAYNYFQEELFNLVGNMIIRQVQWKNPFAIFKRPQLEKGQDIAEVALGLAEAKGWNYRDSNLFKREPHKVYESVHRLNRADRFDMSIDSTELAKAFNTTTGLNDFVNQKINVLGVSDEKAEYEISKNLFKQAFVNGDMYNVNVSLANVLAPTREELVDFSTKVRTMTETVNATLSGHYNAAGVPTRSTVKDMVLIISPALKAALETNVLADAFNQDHVAFQPKIIVIDKFPIDGVYAMLVDKAFFVMADYVRSLESFYNPKNRVLNLYLHHHGVYSYSRYVTAISFSDRPDTNKDVVEVDLTGLTAKFVNEEDETTTVFNNDYKENGTYLLVESQGTVTPDVPEVIVPGAYTVQDIKITDAEGVAKSKTSRTYVDRTGQLFVQKGLVSGDVITVKVLSTYYNPQDGDDSVKATATATITVE